jgi:CBS domain-containing protein
MSYQQLLVRTALQGEPVRRFMNTQPITVPPDTSVRDLVEDYIYRFHHRMYPVVDPSQQLLGCVSTEQVKAVPRDEWGEHRVGEILQPCSVRNTISPDTDAAAVLSKMSKTGTSRLMVVEQGRLLALVSSRDLTRFLSTKLELEGYPGTDVPDIEIQEIPVEEEKHDKTRTAGG